MRLGIPVCQDCDCDILPYSLTGQCEDCYDATHCEHCDEEIERNDECMLCDINQDEDWEDAS